MPAKYKYSDGPEQPVEYTRRFDRFYTRFARLYDWMVKILPVWRAWLAHALPYIQGERILEISFGTGYLLTQYAVGRQVIGLDYNLAMIHTARQNLASTGLEARLIQGDALHLPFASQSFDTLVNTMAFTGYANGSLALSEMRRVLMQDGRLVMLDINYPTDRNWAGTLLTRFWMASGDLIRDMGPLFLSAGFAYEDYGVGGFGSVHLYLAQKLPVDQ